MKYIDLFSGIGGFHLGLKMAGFKFDWVGFSEIDLKCLGNAVVPQVVEWIGKRLLEILALDKT